MGRTVCCVYAYDAKSHLEFKVYICDICICIYVLISVAGRVIFTYKCVMDKSKKCNIIRRLANVGIHVHKYRLLNSYGFFEKEILLESSKLCVLKRII